MASELLPNCLFSALAFERCRPRWACTHDRYHFRGEANITGVQRFGEMYIITTTLLSNTPSLIFLNLYSQAIGQNASRLPNGYTTHSREFVRILSDPPSWLLKWSGEPTRLTTFAPDTAISLTSKSEASNEIVLCYASFNVKPGGSLTKGALKTRCMDIKSKLGRRLVLSAGRSMTSKKTETISGKQHACVKIEGTMIDERDGKFSK